MQAVILAGGFGTRISEYSTDIPKPMVPIWDKPVLVHLMELLFAQGVSHFIIATGYKSSIIKKYFYDSFHSSSDLDIDFNRKTLSNFNSPVPPWRVTVVDTGLNTSTGGRLLRLRDFLTQDTSLVTYGDGLANVNIHDLREIHQSQRATATLTAVRPPARFGELAIRGNTVLSFEEKPQLSQGWINGGFILFEPSFLDYIHSDDTMLEREPLSHLALEGKLSAHFHTGFWQCMDTKRDHTYLESLDRHNPPWLAQ